MLDIQGRTPAVPVPPPCSDVQFYSLELTPLPDGQLHVGFTATLVDEVELEFVNQQIASDRVASIEDVVALIRQHVRPGLPVAASAQSS